MQSQQKYDIQTGLVLVSDNSSHKDIDSKIARYKQLQYQAKVIEAEMALIKKDIISECFDSDDCYYDSNGFLAATYKSQIRISLDQTKLKKEDPNTFDKYSDMKEIKVLLIK